MTATAAAPALAHGGQQPAPGEVMFVYALHQPIDFFDALVPLPQWIAADPNRRTRWALQAILALADTAEHVRWEGDMRHLPSVGAVPTSSGTCPYLVVKQDNNGTTFLISAADMPWLNEQVEHAAHTDARAIGAWIPPTLLDIEPADEPGPESTEPDRQDLSF